MVTNPEFEQFLGFPYRFNNGPEGPTDIEKLSFEGVNCQLFTHLVLRELFGISLPANLLSKEIFEDDYLFRSVEEEKIVIGDIFFFGRKDEDDFRRLHLAVCIGRDEETKKTLLIHATPIEGKVSIWPLDKFGEFERYQKLYGIKRLITE